MNTRYITISLCLLVLLVGCTKQLITEPELTQLKTDKANLETKNSDLQKETDNLKDQVKALQGDAKLWSQLLEGYKAQPYDPPMQEHAWADLGDGTYAFLHFSKPLTAEDKELMYIGLALPGTFCKEDQEQLPPAFGHFHQSKCSDKDPEKCHAGKGGEEGYWLMHVAVRDLDMPWGAVKAGVDTKFMLTTPPSCAPAEEAPAEEEQ